MIKSDVQRLAADHLVELFELDATALGQGILRWHDGVNSIGSDVVWQGVLYTRYPVEATGFEKTSKGTLPRPVLKVGNIGGLIGQLAYETEDLVGTAVTRHRTFAKYLDAVNFPGGVNPTADPNVAFVDEVWSVDRKAAQNPVFVEFELSSAFDVQGVQLPRRQVIQNVCPWKYRGSECGYAGPDVPGKDLSTGTPLVDQCGKRLQDCKDHFGQYSRLTFGGFPGAGLVR